MVSSMTCEKSDCARNDRPLRVSGARARFLVRAASLAMLVVAAHAVLPSTPAQAQIAALVNGEPITALDVQHRMRLIQISSRKQPTRQEALEELIDDKLKLSIAKRYTINITDREVDATFASIASRSGASPQQFEQMLSQAGLTGAAFKAKLRSDIAWQSIVRGKFQSSLQVGERDVVAALESKTADQKSEVSIEYRLRPILFVVPRGSPQSAVEARLREAEGFRSRFQSCDEGLALARTLPDVAVRSQVIRLSVDIPAQQREVLNATAVGRLTPPDVTQQGIELFAICAKNEVRSTDTPQKREARDQIVNERFQALSKRYLQELRRSAMIEIR